MSDPYAHLAERGRAGFEQVMAGFGPIGEQEPGSLGDLAQKLVFGELWQRPHLDVRDRRLITLTANAVVGNQDVIGMHIRAALSSGDLTPEQLGEVVIQLAFYAGFPVATTFNTVLQRELARRREPEEGGAQDEG